MKVRSLSGSRAFVPVLAAFLLTSAAPSHAATDPAVACAIAKHKTAVKKLSSKVKCHAKALKAGAAVDTACLGQAEAKFVAAFAKAQNKAGCLSVDETDDIETLIDDTLEALLDGVPATTTTITTLPQERCCTTSANCAFLSPAGCEEFSARWVARRKSATERPVRAKRQGAQDIAARSTAPALAARAWMKERV